MSEEIKIEEGIEKQKAYVSASKVCDELTTFVPTSMSHEQYNWNTSLESKIGMPVDDYVMDRLRYIDYKVFCKAFAKEQIDAIATAIFNFENSGNALILADQTGVGKGRTIAGILRYCVKYLGKTPIFFTEKKHLIMDIYRDIIDIQWDCGIPEKFTTSGSNKEYTDSDILNVIKKDVKDDELSIDFDFTEVIEGISDNSEFNLKDLLKDENYEILELVIQSYRDELESGSLVIHDKESYRVNVNYDSQVKDRMQKGFDLVRPFILNSIDVEMKNGNILYEKPKSHSKIISSRNLPSEYKVVMSTYTQIQRAFQSNGELSDKGKFIMKFANESIIVMDESHAAGGAISSNGEPSNTFRFMAMVLRNCKNVLFSSATFSKRPDNVPIYAIKTSIRESNMNINNIVNAFRNGGNIVTEAVSSQLTKIGQLMRRQKLITGRTDFLRETDTTETGQTQIIKLNRISGLHQKIISFQGELKNEYEKILRAYFTNKEDRNKFKEQFKLVGSIERFNYLMFKFFLFAIKINQTIEKASEQLNSGKKVIIAIANTLESAFNNIKNENDEKYEIGDTVPNDFSMYLKYLLEYTMNIRYTSDQTRIDDSGNEIEASPITYSITDIKNRKTPISDTTMLAIADSLWSNYIDNFNKIKEEILDTVTNTPLSPIDVVTNELRNRGVSVGEITGRKKRLSFDVEYENEKEKIYNYQTGTLEKIPTNEKNNLEIIKKFNENKLDVIILNQSGAVGISLHATPTVSATTGKIIPPVTKINDIDEKDITKRNPPVSLKPIDEVKQRCMIVVDMEADVNKEIQKLGRIDRTGQVYPPYYIYLISSIPAETRFSSIMEKKIRSLSASVAADQEESSHLYSAVDFFSDEASEPFKQVIEDNKWQGFVKNFNKEGIYNFTKKTYFWSYDNQKMFYDQFEVKFIAHLNYLKSNDLYTGKVLVKDYKAVQKGIIPLYIGNSESYSSFGRHSYIELNECVVYAKKKSELDIRDEIEKHLTILKSGEEKSFSKIEDYNKNVISVCKDLESSYDLEYQNNVNTSDSIISKNKEKIEELNIEIKKFDKLEYAISLNKKISDLQKQVEELSAKSVTLVVEGNIEELNKLTKQTQAIVNELNKVKEEWNSDTELQEVFSIKDDKDDFVYQISRLERGISSEEESKIRFLAEFEEQKRVLSIFLKSIDLIGKIIQLKRFNEKKSEIIDDSGDAIYDDNGNILQKYEYDLDVDEKVVVTGVFFENDFSYSTLTLGKINVRYTTPTENGEFTLNMTDKLISEKNKLSGAKHTVVIESIGEFYKDNWNKHLKTVDTGSKQDVVFISGNLLKAYGTILNSTSGAIIKYNTQNNKVKIGVQLKKELKDKYITVFEGGAEYNILFDINKYNIENIIIKNIEHQITKENEIWVLRRRISNLKGFFFETSEVGSFLYITPKYIDSGDYELDALKSYLSDIKNYNIAICFNSLGVKKFIKRVENIMDYGINVNEFNIYSQKSSELLDFNNITYVDYSIISKRNYFEINQDTFINSYDFRNDFFGKGISIEHAIIFDYDSFMKLTENMNAEYEAFSCFVSNKVFDNVLDKYSFDYSDEDLNISTSATGSIVIDKIGEGVADKINEYLNKLVELLKN